MQNIILKFTGKDHFALKSFTLTLKSFTLTLKSFTLTLKSFTLSLHKPLFH